MAIDKCIVSNILDSMNYNDFGHIEISNDEFTSNTVIMVCISEDVTIERVYFIDKKENNIMFEIRRDTYHETFDNNTRFFEIDINKAYLKDERIINSIDDYIKQYTNNFNEVKELNDSVYFDSILKLFWYYAETIYNDRYDSVSFTVKLLCNYMDDCEVQFSFFDNYAMSYNI